MLKKILIVCLIGLSLSCGNNKDQVKIQALEKELESVKILHLNSVDENLKTRQAYEDCVSSSEDLKVSLNTSKANIETLCRSHENVSSLKRGEIVTLENRGKTLKDLKCIDGDIKGMINRVSINARTLNMTLVYKGQNLALRPLDPTGTRVYDRSIVLDNFIVQVLTCSDKECTVQCSTISSSDHLLEDSYLNICK